MKVFVVAALHGDEPFGIKITDQLLDNPGIVTKIGHPEAVGQRKRYLEEDLNRSFRSSRGSLEAELAKEIEAEVHRYNADIILDIHTSITKMGKVAIVAEHCPLTISIAGQLGMEAIVVMPEDIAAPSLIGCFPAKALSLEFGQAICSEELARDMASRIENLTLSTEQESMLPIFQVGGHIAKDFQGLAGIKNLQFNEELNGYPFLAGAATYKTTGGFLAQKIN